MADKQIQIFPGVFIAPANGSLADTLSAMDKAMLDYTMVAARGECSWVCADCSVTFPAGMPDACLHGFQACTDIITRDKADSMQHSPGAGKGGE